MKTLLILAAALPAVMIVGLALLSAFSGRPETLGLHQGRLRECPPSPNCVCSLDADDGHRVEPFLIPTDADSTAVLNRLETLVASLPGARIATRGENYLHAEFTSALFRFVDDVEFHVDAEHATIHVRSASRVGHSDLGANRRRVESLREQWRAQMTNDK